jgi:hypothetical protein
VLARAETHLDAIPGHMTSANRSLRAIESVGGAFANMITTQKSINVEPVAAAKIVERVVEQLVDIPIVHKWKDDSLHLAV